MADMPTTTNMDNDVQREGVDEETILVDRKAFLALQSPKHHDGI